MEREASIFQAATIVRPTVVVVLPIAVRALCIGSAVGIRAIIVAHALQATIQATRARTVHALALLREVAAASFVRCPDLTAGGVDLAILVNLGVHDVVVVT